MVTRLEILGLTAAAVAVGTVYVMVHEHRRKKKAHNDGGTDVHVVSVERLVDLLSESAHAAFELIEQTRKMVHQKAQQSGQRCAPALVFCALSRNSQTRGPLHSTAHPAQPGSVR